MKYTIDAQNKKLGRVAGEAAALLMGKNRTDFTRNSYPADVIVEVINVSKAAVETKKLLETKYARYSGYPGGLRYETMKRVTEKKGYAGLFREMVHGMLPKNKLQAKMIKQLVVSE
jgi:large subunit ribosomal protein L13